jgi:hypothetical protein
MNIIQAIEHKDMFLDCFEDLSTWKLWIVLLKAAFAIPMTEWELEQFKKFTERTEVPTQEVKSLVICAGRRSGKSFIIALMAVYLSVCRDWRPKLSVGEWATVQVIAADRAQATTVLSYISGILNSTEALKKEETKETKQEITLPERRVKIIIQTASFRTLRGRTLIACICDEICFWLDQGASPDHLIVEAAVPALMTLRELGSKLIMLSSPWAQRGIFYEYFKEGWGKNIEDELVWRSAIEKQLKRNPESASSEWLSHWRSDLAAFLRAELIDELTVEGRYELAPVPGQHYLGFADTSAGGKDAYSMAIAHREGDALVLDCVRYYDPPFDPYHVTAEYCGLFKDFWIDTVHGDRFTGTWIETAFRQNNVRYIPSKLTKSDIYLGIEAEFHRKNVQLLDNERLIVEAKNLERSTRKVGRPLVDHAPMGSDDVINSAAGALYHASQTESTLIVFDPLQEDDRVIRPYD